MIGSLIELPFIWPLNCGVTERRDPALYAGDEVAHSAEAAQLQQLRRRLGGAGDAEGCRTRPVVARGEDGRDEARLSRGERHGTPVGEAVGADREVLRRALDELDRVQREREGARVRDDGRLGVEKGPDAPMPEVEARRRDVDRGLRRRRDSDRLRLRNRGRPARAGGTARSGRRGAGGSGQTGQRRDRRRGDEHRTDRSKAANRADHP